MDLPFLLISHFTSFGYGKMATSSLLKSILTYTSEFEAERKRFALSRYLGLTEEEMTLNADWWAEESYIPKKKQSKATQMRAGGVTKAGVSSDLDQFEEPTADPEAPAPGTPGPGAPGTTPGGGGSVPGAGGTGGTGGTPA